MKAKEFVARWKAEKENLLSTYTKDSEDTHASAVIKSMDLSEEQKEKMREVIDTILTDTFYGLLLGLDGEAQIGGVQETFKIHDSEGNLISECGELEAEAWEQFHGE